MVLENDCYTLESKFGFRVEIRMRIPVGLEPFNFWDAWYYSSSGVRKILESALNTRLDACRRCPLTIEVVA